MIVKKFINIILNIFSIGMLTIVLLGAVSLLGYIVAMFIGGELATEISRVILKICLPWVIRITSILAGIGLLAMYLLKTLKN